MRPHPGISLRQRVDGNDIVGCYVRLLQYHTPSYFEKYSSNSRAFVLRSFRPRPVDPAPQAPHAEYDYYYLYFYFYSYFYFYFFFFFFLFYYYYNYYYYTSATTLTFRRPEKPKLSARGNARRSGRARAPRRNWVAKLSIEFRRRNSVATFGGEVGGFWRNWVAMVLRRTVVFVTDRCETLPARFAAHARHMFFVLAHAWCVRAAWYYVKVTVEPRPWCICHHFPYLTHYPCPLSPFYYSIFPARGAAPARSAVRSATRSAAPRIARSRAARAPVMSQTENIVKQISRRFCYPDGIHAIAIHRANLRPGDISEQIFARGKRHKVQRAKRAKLSTARATRRAKHAERFPDFEVRRATRLSLGVNQKIFAILQWVALVSRGAKAICLTNCNGMRSVLARIASDSCELQPNCTLPSRGARALCLPQAKARPFLSRGAQAIFSDCSGYADKAERFRRRGDGGETAVRRRGDGGATAGRRRRDGGATAGRQRNDSGTTAGRRRVGGGATAG